MYKIILMLVFMSLTSCTTNDTTQLQLGAERLDTLLPLLANKKIGLVVNQTSMVHSTHLVDTLLALIEACAENNIPVIVLDRPNPLGYYIDGPGMEPEFASFIGMHPVPVVHGMTIGEYALMINGESWLVNGIKCDLDVVPMKNYTHRLRYHLPISPSPNLPDMKSIYRYPSICYFEGTNVSEGRGTDTPFQQFGAPYFTPQVHLFTPESKPGIAANPKYQGETCYGYDLSTL